MAATATFQKGDRAKIVSPEAYNAEGKRFQGTVKRICDGYAVVMFTNAIPGALDPPGGEIALRCLRALKVS